MEDQLFFVGIRDPIELRKELLTSSKNLIDSLRRYEAYKGIKEEKLRHIMELKRVFDELLVMNKKLRNKMPHIPVKAAPTLARETREPPKGKTMKMSKSKIDVLEEELAKIEERLGGLE
jgi:hypothetical protein